MIKTLRITSVAAVILAAVVLASVLGFLRPDSFLPLRVGTGSDKQTESILKGPSAVERFKTQYGVRGPDGPDTTPPLIKQAELLAGIINPPEPSPDTGPKGPTMMPPRPTVAIKPAAPVSSKFNLVATSCCSSNPKFSYAHIRLPDNTFQWVGVGEQIGHVTIKEIRKDSVLCWDGTGDSEVLIDAVPETSSLLETANASNAVPSTTGEDSDTPTGPTAGTTQPATASSARPGKLAKPPSSMFKPPSSAAKSSSGTAKASSPAAQASTAVSQPAVPVTSAPSAQITKQEQEKLSRLGDRLKNSADIDAAGQAETANRLINEFKSTQSLPPGVRELGDSAETDPGPEPLNKTLREEARRRYSGRLTPPRAPKE